jgi:hypothetical protein
LGKNKSSVSNCNINYNIEQIFHAINEYEKLGLKVFICKIPDTDYFLYGTDDDISLGETNLPMYIQVLDQSNIKVYDMVFIRKERGGFRRGWAQMGPFRKRAPLRT